jgi:transposase
MFEPVSRSTKLESIILAVQGAKQTDIAESLQISVSVVQTVKARYKKYGDVDAGYQKRGAKSVFPVDVQFVPYTALSPVLTL